MNKAKEGFPGSKILTGPTRIGQSLQRVSQNSTSGFTLIELIAVIGIIGILAAVIVIFLNPLELLHRARDGKRFSDLESINSSLALYQTDEGTVLGTTTIIYISIPDTSATCANLTLPGLPMGWAYNCVTQANLRKIDSTGWVPVDFIGITSGPPISKLPIDPNNSDSEGLYYTYVTGSDDWELDATLQSVKEAYVAASDGGDDSTKLEAGTDLTLFP